MSTSSAWRDPVTNPPPHDVELLLEMTFYDERGRESHRAVVVARWVSERTYWFTSFNTILEIDPFRSITGWQPCPAARPVSDYSKLRHIVRADDYIRCDVCGGLGTLKRGVTCHYCKGHRSLPRPQRGIRANVTIG